MTLGWKGGNSLGLRQLKLKREQACQEAAHQLMAGLALQGGAGT